MLAELQKERIRRRGLMEFVRVFWQFAESADFVEEPHMTTVARHLEGCALRATKSLKRSQQPWMDDLEEIKDLVIAIPPGMSKSLITLVFFPSWVWTWAPSCKFICTSYSDQLAIRDGKRAFDLMSSELYREMYPEVDIIGGERASMQFYTNSKKGMRFSTALGSSATGFHSHLLLADDPTKPADLELGGDSAMNALEKIRTRWDDTFSSRSAHPATFTRIIIAQRLAVEDLSGIMISRGAQHLCLPMEADLDRLYTSAWGSDHRTQPGELLAPLRFPADVVESRKKWLSARTWQAQYAQDPSPEAGAIFDRAWFNRYHSGLPPQGARTIIAVDSSNKDGPGTDYTVVQCWARKGSQLYLLDQDRFRGGFSDQVRAIQRMRSSWAGCNQVLIETKANGNAILDQLKKTMTGVIGVDPLGGKLSRMMATEPYWRAGDILLPPNKPWLGEFIEEFIQVPNGRFDDQPDCAAMAVAFLTSKDRAQRFRAGMAGARNKMNRGYSWS